ncbi:MAG: hypothetical protein HS111_13740 [Kofleriaceae bacterium]|nr:hypothetical protein [Kofleriaceae bacterium]MCL4227467.1 hypothetical protein [Myxococcales bacterium]
MPLARTPLDASALTRLSPAAQKALAPGPGRAMAARGLLPLPSPAELATVLYHLVASDPAVAAAAQASAQGLPEKVLAAALADAAIDPRVLDWLAPRARATPALFEALVLNPRVDDLTIVDLAGAGDPREVDLIAGNEQRLLRCPDIIAAMYANPQARMSTVDRAVELAVRNQVRVGGISAWDELARVVAGSPSSSAAADDDAVFAQALAGVQGVADSAVVASTTDDAVEDTGGAPVVDEKQVPITKMSVPAKIRLASLGNAFARSLLIRDPIRMVALAAIKAPGVSDLEAAKYAGNHSLDNDVIRYIATRREWTRLYGIKKSLCMNPKTPISESSKMLIHMRENDVRQIAKSKGVPSAVVAQARKLIAQRSGGGK